MYEEIAHNPEAWYRYVQANSFTVPGKALICRKVVHWIQAFGCSSDILILGGDLGWNGLLLSGFFPESSITLIDRSSAALSHARLICSSKRFNFIEEDILCMSKREIQADIAVGIFILHLLEPLSAALSEVNRVLRSGGLFAIAFVTKDQWNRGPIGSHADIVRKGIFPECEDIIARCSTAGFHLLANEELTRIDEISTDEIPYVFGQYSNSYLRSIPPDNLTSLHESLKIQSSDGKLRLSMPCQLMMFRSGGD